MSFSLGLHAAILLACMLVIQQRATQVAPPPPVIVELEEFLPKARKSQPHEATQQVVRTREADNDRVPEEKAYLGERNQTVERQQVSQNGGSRAGAKARPAAQAPTANLSRFGVAMLPSTSERREAMPGDDRVREYVTGVNAGEETALSTREFVFHGYFERIRQRLDHAWEPILRDHLLRHYRQGRRLASEMDHKTQVLVVLDGQGKIVRVEITGESGTESLDSAAIQAFNRAGPFPNPPRGLVGKDGSVRIQWEFILKT